jgi:hypothetical protein
MVRQLVAGNKKPFAFVIYRRYDNTPAGAALKRRAD